MNLTKDERARVVLSWYLNGYEETEIWIGGNMEVDEYIETFYNVYSDEGDFIRIYKLNRKDVFNVVSRFFKETSKEYRVGVNFFKDIENLLEYKRHYPTMKMQDLEY